MNPNWHEDFFQGLALEVWRRANPPARTAREARFLMATLAARRGAALLDAPCGDGRLALRLAAEGYRVTAVDQSAPWLAAGEAAARRRGLAVAWRRGDLRRLRGLAAHAGAYCFGNSFAYADRAATQAFLRGVGRALAPGGRFVLDTEFAAETFLPRFEPRARREVGDITLTTNARYLAAESRVEVRYTFEQGRRRETRDAVYWIYTVGEITHMLAEAGLEAMALFESTAQRPFRLGSPRLLLVAERPR